MALLEYVRETLDASRLEWTPQQDAAAAELGGGGLRERPADEAYVQWHSVTDFDSWDLSAATHAALRAHGLQSWIDFHGSDVQPGVMVVPIDDPESVQVVVRTWLFVLGNAYPGTSYVYPAGAKGRSSKSRESVHQLRLCLEQAVGWAERTLITKVVFVLNFVMTTGSAKTCQGLGLLPGAGQHLGCPDTWGEMADMPGALGVDEQPSARDYSQTIKHMATAYSASQLAAAVEHVHTHVLWELRTDEDLRTDGTVADANVLTEGYRQGARFGSHVDRLERLVVPRVDCNAGKYAYLRNREARHADVTEARKHIAALNGADAMESLLAHLTHAGLQKQYARQVLWHENGFHSWMFTSHDRVLNHRASGAADWLELGHELDYRHGPGIALSPSEQDQRSEMVRELCCFDAAKGSSGMAELEARTQVAVGVIAVPDTMYMANRSRPPERLDYPPGHEIFDSYAGVSTWAAPGSADGQGEEDPQASKG